MPPITGRIYDRNRLDGPTGTNRSLENRQESIYGLLALRSRQVKDQRSAWSKSLARADPDFRGRSKRSGLSPSHRNAQ